MVSRYPGMAKNRINFQFFQMVSEMKAEAERERQQREAATAFLTKDSMMESERRASEEQQSTGNSV